MERASEADAVFWTRVRAELGRDDWEYFRTEDREPTLGWSKATQDTLRRPLRVVRADVPAEKAPEFSSLEVLDLSWTLYDHGVLLVEGRFRTRADVESATLRDHDFWEDEVQQAGEVLTLHCRRHGYRVLYEALQGMSDTDTYVNLDDHDAARPLWVTRAVMLDPADADSVAFAESWVAGIDADHRRMFEEIVEGSRSSVARWMNHVHRTDRAEQVDHLWRSLQKAQFFWSAMQGVDDSLRAILSWSMAPRAEVSLEELRRDLRSTMNQAQELLMLRADVRQDVSRKTHAEMEGFLGFWEYGELLEEPVRDKVEICKDRLASIAQDRASRSAMFTDIILMSIGVTSVLATAIALVQFGRDASQDPSQSIFDLGNGSITSWVSSQSMDGILIISLLLSIVLIVVFIWKRRQSIE
jgi:hypothetical protein